MSNPIVPIAKLCVRKELKGRVGGGGGGGTNESGDPNLNRVLSNRVKSI